MSSIKLSSEATKGKTLEALEAEQAAWIEVKSPLSERPMPSAMGVVYEITKLRERYGRRPDSVAMFPDDQDYGSGDAELADEIAQDMEGRWDG